MLIRNRHRGYDLVIGHTRKVFAHPGERIHRGQKIALASDNGAPDGCHLHFEKRAVEGGLDTATRPRKLLQAHGRRNSRVRAVATADLR